MAKGRTQEEKVRFIEENMNLIPKKSVVDFQTWDFEKQYTKMCQYVSKSKKPQINTKSIVSNITKLNPSKKQVESIITQLENWLNGSVTREIEDIKKQQSRLEKRLKELQTK